MESTENLSATPAQIASLIRKRATFKVLGDVEQPVEISPTVASANRPKVLDAIQTAGWAPFHYDRAVDGIAEPWRVHVLWHHECRLIANHFHDWFDDIKPGNKLPAMLSACGALALITWLPQFKVKTGTPATDETPEKQQTIDEEHLAATAALTQNLLLMLTAHGMGSYWSSGGQFRTREMFERLGINSTEQLLAAVFVEFPETMQQEIDRVPGKQRDKRSSEYRWIREPELKTETE